MSKVSVLGLGAMGSRMARALVDAGHCVTVWNRTPARAEAIRGAGASFAGTPREATSAAEFVIAMLRDDEASRTVWLDRVDGALAGMKPGAVAVESSTLSVAWVRELAREAAQAGLSFLDAPVAGSRPQADARQLIFLAGGDGADVARTTPVLRAMGSAVHHCGPAGAGAAIKLAVNALLGVQVAVVAELLALLGKSGIDLPRGDGYPRLNAGLE